MAALYVSAGLYDDVTVEKHASEERIDTTKAFNLSTQFQQRNVQWLQMNTYLIDTSNQSTLLKNNDKP